MLNRIGPKTVPCGTLISIDLELDYFCLYEQTVCDYKDKTQTIVIQKMKYYIEIICAVKYYDSKHQILLKNRGCIKYLFHHCLYWTYNYQLSTEEQFQWSDFLYKRTGKNVLSPF